MHSKGRQAGPGSGTGRLKADDLSLELEQGRTDIELPPTLRGLGAATALATTRGTQLAYTGSGWQLYLEYLRQVPS